jgi:hypothetical protein
VKSTAGLITPHPDRPLSEPCNKPPTRHTQGAGGNSISSSIASQGGWRGSPVPSNQSRGKFRVLEVAGCSWETSDCVLHLGGRCGETHGPDGHMVARYVVVRVVEECPRSSCAVQKRTMPTCERSISARGTTNPDCSGGGRSEALACSTHTAVAREAHPQPALVATELPEAPTRLPARRGSAQEQVGQCIVTVTHVAAARGVSRTRQSGADRQRC